MANRTFNRKQALEKEVKELYVSGIMAREAATATLDLTVDIELTSVAKGRARNTNTFTLEVAAAAANPTDTVLAAFTGTAAAIICTITPNDGTNNGAVAVDLTTAELAELINTGAVAGKTVTVTDGSSLRALQTAEGGGPEDLADGGEGDGVVATFSGGDVVPSLSSRYGIASIVSDGAGSFILTLEDKYVSLKSFKGVFLKSTGEDLRVQVKAEDVDGDKTIAFLTLTGATATDPSEDLQFFLRTDLKNTTVI